MTNGKTKALDLIIESFPRAKSALNFYKNAGSVILYRSEIFEFCHTFNGYISCADFVILTYILFKRQEPILKFSYNSLLDKPPSSG
jgi:hypothetical protein